jgi:DNA-binding NtrC family response regulator
MYPEVMIGESLTTKKLEEQIEKVAPLTVTVLITGETGTGKDLAATRIHQLSGRSRGPFVPVNMGAIPRELVASTLFGHEKGSFTGADRQTGGLFERARGGTLFLDEIETTDEKTQISLLRVLETKCFQRVGGSDFIDTDVRILAASNQNLREAIREGSFREDLYYRLNVFAIEVPPLRKRGADILLLAGYFLKHYSRELDKNVTRISPEAEKLLTSYKWPGNVRELENLMLRAVVSATGDTVTDRLLARTENREASARDRVKIEVGSSLESLERTLIKLTLDKVLGSKTLAAEMLGLSRKGIYNKMKRYNL